MSGQGGYHSNPCRRYLPVNAGKNQQEPQSNIFSTAIWDRNVPF